MSINTINQKNISKKVLIFIAVVLVLALTSVKLYATPINIIIDTNRVLSDVSNRDVGIGLHFLGDRTNISTPLKQIKAGTLRFGTGEYSLFDKNEPAKPKVAIQDKDLWQVKSFAKPDGTWHSKVNFDDFMTICKSIEAEPFIILGIDAIAYIGNKPHATSEEVLKSTVELVKYANIVKKYNVKYWEIGNESDLQTNPKIKWTPEKYAETVVLFSQAMKAVDPSIKVGANGMRLKNPSSDWWDRVMPVVKNDVDFLITHQYSWIENYEQWKNDIYEYNYNIADATEAINKYNSKLRLNVTEISSQNPTVKDKNNIWRMLHNFEIIGQTLIFGKVDHVHFWTSRWLEKDASLDTFSAFDSNYKLMPMGFPIKVWTSFLKKKMVYASKLDPIRSWASYDPENNSLNLFLLNKDRLFHDVEISLKNYHTNAIKERWILKGDTPDSTNVTWKKLNNFRSIDLNKSKIYTKLEPLSVNVICLDR